MISEAKGETSEERIKLINALIAMKKQADLMALTVEGHLQDLELEYQREINGGSSASIIHGLDGYLGIRSAAATPMAPRSRRPGSNSAAMGIIRDDERIFTRAPHGARTSSHHRHQHMSSADDDFGRGTTASEEQMDDEDGDNATPEDDSDYETRRAANNISNPNQRRKR